MKNIQVQQIIRYDQFTLVDEERVVQEGLWLNPPQQQATESLLHHGIP